MRHFALLAATAATLAAAGTLHAATVDGTLDPLAYGAALATQANATGFGDNSYNLQNPLAPSTAISTGSELDAAYAQVTGGTLYLFFAGNLETNFNHLNVYLDTNAGGLASNSPAANSSVTFDTGFTADRLIDLNGNGAGLYVNYSNLDNGTGSFLGQFATTGAVVTAGDGNGNAPATFQLAYDNSNVLGVTGDQTTTTTVAAGLVNTGFEIAIDLASLGIDGTTIKVAALVNGGGNTYLSNQTLGTLAAGTSNLGSGTVDLNTFSGDQFFTITGVPEPASLGLLGLAGVGLLRRRK